MDPADESDVAAAVDGDVAGTVRLEDGSEMPVVLPGDLVQRAQANGVDPDRLRSAAVPSGTVDLKAQTDRDATSTIPVQSDRQTDLTNRLKRDRDFQFIQDEQIQRLQQNSINYTERVGRWLLAEDDLIPTVKERLKALITGEDGIDVEPADPDDDADQRLADVLGERYDGDIRPTEVIDTILRENLMNARAVLRATDLKELDLASLDFLRDGVTGEEIYIQDRQTVWTFDLKDDDVDDDAPADAIPGIDLETQTLDAQPLVIGEHVFDISLYDTPPLEAVADTAVNKMVLQRLKARKAEITSFGAVYASVEPPSYLPEDQYFDRVADEDWDGEGSPPTKLERAMNQNIQNAFDTLKDFQSGTVMAVPDFWSLEQLEIPETGDPIDDQIRGYNRDISRRLLVPLDLIELQSGSELSRETMFATLMTTIAGWRREIKRVFDQFAETVADIEDISGDVDHTFPPLKDADTQNVIAALQHAGIAGLTEQEVRQMMNVVQGVDLETDPDELGQDPSAPSDGGPDDPGQRQQDMEQFLEDQRRGADNFDVQDADDDGDPDAPADQGGQQDGQAALTAAAVDEVGDTLRETSTSVRQANSGDSNSLQFDMDFGMPSVAPPKPSKVTVQETTTVSGGSLALPRVPQTSISREQLEARIDDMLADITDPDMPLFARVAERDPDWEPFVDIGGGVDPELLERLTDELPQAYMALFDNVTASQAAAEEHDSDDMDVDLTIPDAVQNAAQQALDARDDPDVTVNGMTDTGWARAEQLADGGELTEDDILGGSDGMAVWWSRHFEDNLDTSGDQTTVAVDDEHEDNPWADNSYTAAKGWGGVAGARFAFQKAAELTAGTDDEDDWRDWVDRVQASRVEGRRHGPNPLSDVAPIPDDVQVITKDDLALWVAWLRQGKPTQEDFQAEAQRAEGRSFNPSLHPRGPDGKFVERPWDIPDSLELDSIRTTPTVQLLEELKAAGEPVDDVLANDDIRVDGIPDDVNSVSQAKAQMGGDALAFQDLEVGDRVTIQNDDTGKTTGQVKKTEVVPGKANQVTVETPSGSTHVVSAPDGVSISRLNGPSLPPAEATDENRLLSAEDLTEGQQVAVLGNLDSGDDSFLMGAGPVTQGAEGVQGDQFWSVDGEGFDPSHPNIGVYDASPDAIDFTSLEDGQVVDIVSDSTGKKLGTGPVVDTYTSQDGSIQYADLELDAEGTFAEGEDVTTVNLANWKPYPPSGDVDVDPDGDGDGSDAPDPIPDDPPQGADAIDPASLNPYDFGTADLNELETAADFSDVAEGDWVSVKKSDGQKVAGKVIGTSGTGAFTVDTGDGTDDVTIGNTQAAFEVPPSKVEELGDPPGINTSNTQTPDPPESDLSSEDITHPNSPSFVEDDLVHGVTNEDGDVGVLTNDQVQGMTDFLADTPGQPLSSVGTRHNGNTKFPYNKADNTTSAVGKWLNEADITDSDGQMLMDNLKNGVSTWKGQSYNNNGQRLERAFHSALDLAGPFVNDGLSGKNPTADETRAAAAATAYTQQFFRENFDDFTFDDAWGTDADLNDGEMPLYRGPGKNAIASLARDWGADPEADSVTVKESKMTNFTTDPKTAEGWGEQDVVLKKNATVDDVVMAPDMAMPTSHTTESEVWLPGGVDAADPSNIRVTRESDGGMTMEDLQTQPEDLDTDQLRVLKGWAWSMNERGYTLDSEDQIETWDRVADRLEDSYISESDVEQMVQRSRDVLDSNDQPTPIEDPAEQALSPSAPEV